MKNNRLKIISIFIIILLALSYGIVFANNELDIKLQKAELSEEYQEWQNLSDEEKAKRIEPARYVVQQQEDTTTYLKNLKNVFRTQSLLRASIPAQYNLKNYIPQNTTIKDQMSTNSCWAFATIGALETNLAIKDYNNSQPAKTYDFSERHMIYSSVRSAFLNNAVNEYGYNMKPSDGGNFYMGIQYIINGLGAVNESDLPFEDNENNINIAQIQNKEVQTTLYEAENFPTVETSNRSQIMDTMKQYIMNNGGLYVNIHGASLVDNRNYNNTTGAIYCANSDTAPIDHGVILIGWDDNYSRNNFNENQRPSSDGAWIIKNSWGSSLNLDVQALKQQIFENNYEECIQNGYNTADSIPNAIIEMNLKNWYGESKVQMLGNVAIVKVGDNGYMYISYEDCNVYSAVSSITDVKQEKDYDNIYHLETFGGNSQLYLETTAAIELANVFTRDTSKQEEIDRISFYSVMDYSECKVLINPNGDSKAPEDLVEAKLKEGDTKSVIAGYNSFELAEPIKLNSDKFVVVIQILDNTATKHFEVESQTFDNRWAYATINPGESFYTYGNNFNVNAWKDFAEEDGDLRGNLPIRAYTQNIEEEPVVLEEIYIAQAPNKTVYTEGENFDPTGMKVIAKYSDNTTKEITSYNISGGDNLQVGTTSVTIKYEENDVVKTTTQNITVNAKPIILEELYIEQAPNKTAYTEGENFDTAGMKVMAKYSNGETKQITDYTIIGGENLQEGTTSVTIQYTEGDITKTATQNIVVTKEEEPAPVVLVEISIETAPNKTVYTEGENFDPAGMKIIAKYSDNSTKEITNYTILDGENLQEGTTSVTIQYIEGDITKTATQNITVEKEEIKLQEIFIEEEPDKTTYKEGENFDPTGMKVIARYSNGDYKEITDYTILDGDNLTTSKTMVTIQYEENGVTKTITQAITVEKDEPIKTTLVEIYVDTKPNKLVYKEGENFDPAGMKVVAKYSDNTTKEITDYTILDGENLQEGTTSVTIQYTEGEITKTTTQAIAVIKEEPVEVSLIEIFVDVEPYILEYKEGENFDPTGMKIMAIYSDNTTKEITDYTIIDGENLQEGTTSVTIQYTEGDITKTTTQAISVTNEGTTEEPDPEDPTIIEPVPSNFDNAQAEIQETKMYFDSSDLKNGTIGEIKIKINNIQLGDEENTSYEYYYYLSGTQGDENINDWKKTEITKESDGTYSITLTINSENLNNYEELTESDNLFIYVKEVASTENKTIENVHSLEVENNSEPQCYVDGEYVGGIEDVLNYKQNGQNNNYNSGNTENPKDDTVIPGILPFTGKTAIMIIIVLVAIAGGVFYYRYKNIDR